MAINVDAGTVIIGVGLDTKAANDELGALGSKFDQMADKASKAMTEKFGSAFRLVEDGLKKLGSTVNKVALAMVHEITTALRSLETELTKIQGFMSSMSMVAGPEKSAEQYEFLKKIANELGVSLSSLTENYGRLSAAMVSSGAPLTSVQALFEGLTRASRAYHLSAQDTHWAMYAFTQIASKAKLSMEELNRQFGEKVPGALSIFAESLRGPLEKQLGKTGATIQELKAQLIDLVKAGKIDPIQFSIAVGPDIIAQYQSASEIAAKSVDSSINRLKNTWTDFAKTVVSSGAGEKMAKMFDAITDKLDDTSVLNKFADLLGTLAEEFTAKIKAISDKDIQAGFTAMRDALEGIGKFMASLIDLAKLALPHLREIAVLAGAISGAKLGASIGSALGGPAGGAIGMAAGAAAGGFGTGLLLYPDAREGMSASLASPYTTPRSAYTNQLSAGYAAAYGGTAIAQPQLPASRQLVSGKISVMGQAEEQLATFDPTVYSGRSKLPAYRYQAELDRQKALDNLFLSGSGKGEKAKVDPLRTFMDNLDYKMEGKEEGVSPETLKSLDQLEKAFKKGLAAKHSYAEYKAFIEENDPITIKRLNEQTAALKSSAEAAVGQVKTLEEQVKYYGLYEDQKQSVILAEKEEALARAFNNLSIEDNIPLTKKQLELLSAEIEAREKIANLSRQLEIRSLKESARTAKDKYEEQVFRIISLADENPQDLSTSERDLLIDKATKDFDTLSSKAKGEMSEMSEFAKQAAKNMQDAMADLFFDVMQGKLDDLGSRFKQTIDKMLANAMAANLSNALFGDMGTSGKVGGLVGDLVSWGSNLFADGGVVYGSSLDRLQNSIIDKPVVFPMTGLKPFAKGGIAGEAGTEAIFPVIRDSSGRLAVSGEASSPDINIVVNNTVSDQVDVEIKPKMNNGSMDIDIIVQRVISKDLHRNGSIAQGFTQTFGLNRRV